MDYFPYRGAGSLQSGPFKRSSSPAMMRLVACRQITGVDPHFASFMLTFAGWEAVANCTCCPRPFPSRNAGSATRNWSPEQITSSAEPTAAVQLAELSGPALHASIFYSHQSLYVLPLSRPTWCSPARLSQLPKKQCLVASPDTNVTMSPERSSCLANT